MQQYRVKSAARTLEILEFFSERRAPARLSEISETLGYPVSSVTALLRTLVAMGYMDFDARTHRYHPAPRLSRLTAWMDAGGFEQTVLLDAVHKLRDRVQEPVVVAAPDGLHMEYFISLHRYEGTNTHIKTGARRLMIQNGIGWLLLSRAPVAEARLIYGRTIAKGLFDPALFSEAEYLSLLTEYREKRVSVLHAKDLFEPTAHWNASMISILIPLPDGHHRPLGVGVHGPTHRIIEKREMIKDQLAEFVDELHDLV
jgi:DNA-binding IclR family transcriptional regulator